MFVGKGIMSTFADNYTMSTPVDNPNLSTYVDSDTNVACLTAKSVDRDAMGRGHPSCSKGPSVEPGTARPPADSDGTSRASPVRAIGACQGDPRTRPSQESLGNLDGARAGCRWRDLFAVLPKRFDVESNCLSDIRGGLIDRRTRRYAAR